MKHGNACYLSQLRNPELLTRHESQTRSRVWLNMQYVWVFKVWWWKEKLSHLWPGENKRVTKVGYLLIIASQLKWFTYRWADWFSASILQPSKRFLLLCCSNVAMKQVLIGLSINQHVRYFCYGNLSNGQQDFAYHQCLLNAHRVEHTTLMWI